MQKSFDSLTHLDLFNNDICNSDEYRTKVFKLLPNLKYLDDADADDNDEAEEESDVDDVDEGEDGEPGGANGAEEEDDDDDGKDLDWFSYYLVSFQIGPLALGSKIGSSWVGWVLKWIKIWIQQKTLPDKPK